MREDKEVYGVLEAKKRFNVIPQGKISFVAIPNINNSIYNFCNIKLRLQRRKIIEEQIDKSDAVIVRIPGAFSAIEYAIKKGKKCLAEVVGCPFDALWNHSWKGKVLAPFSFLEMFKGVRNAPNLIYVTDHFLQKRYPSKGRSIGCSDVRLEKIDDNVLVERLRKIQTVTSKRLIIGTAGGLGVKYKGQQYIISAISRLRAKGIDIFEYQIAGAGDKSYLQNLVVRLGLEDCVKFVGSIPHSCIFQWYQGLDIYAQPSRTEGLPRALVEAMSCALPCIGTKVGGIPELLDDSVLFDKGCINQIVKTLNKMHSPEFRMEQAQKCFETSKKYQKDILEEKRVNFMKEVFKG